MSELTDRITEVLLTNSFGKFKDETGEGFNAYAARVADRVAEATRPDFEAVVRALVDCDARFHRIDPRYFRRMAKAALRAAGWSAVEEVQPTGHVSEDCCDDNDCQLHETFRRWGSAVEGIGEAP